MAATKTMDMDTFYAELDSHPGYLIRRLQQMAVAVFMDETQAWGLTPVQYAVLVTVARQPGLDQRGVARAIALDTSTLGSVIDRLEVRGWLQRSHSASDRRVRLLQATPEGLALLEAAEPAVQRAQQRMLQPLPAAQRQQFLSQLAAVLHAHDGLARPPSAGGAARGAE